MLILAQTTAPSTFVHAAPVQISQSQFYSDIADFNLETVTETFDGFPDPFVDL